MKERIRDAFAGIQADDALLEKTAAHLQAERAKREKGKGRLWPLRLVAALAAALVLAVGVAGYRAVYANAAAYVSIDVNPSVELALNRVDKVISATAYNAEGEALLRQVAVGGMPCDDAVAALLAEMEQQGYISGGALVTMTVQTANGAKQQRLCDTLLQSTGGQAGAAQATVEVFPVTREVRETAHGCHMSAAKYLAIQELMAVDETATLEGYSESTIRQIRQRTQACRDAHGGGASGDDSQSGGDGGQGQGDGQGQGNGHGHGHGNHG